MDWTQFLFGNGQAQLAIAPWLIPAILSVVQSGFSLFGGRKRPRRPDFPAYEEAMSPELEARYLAALKRRIGEQVGGSLGSARESAARRGFYRSGQTGAMETDITKAGNRDYAEALMQNDIAKANRRSSWNQLKAQSEQGNYNADLGMWYDEQGARGEGLGSAFSNLANIAMMYGRQPPTGGGGGGQAFFNRAPSNFGRNYETSRWLSGGRRL
jgi:hypothetical protein